MARLWHVKEVVYLADHWHDWTAGRIGADLGRSAPAVYEMARSLGLRKNRPALADSPESRRRIGELHAAGLYDHEIAERLDARTATVSAIRRAMGLANQKRTERHRQLRRQVLQRTCQANAVRHLVQIRQIKRAVDGLTAGRADRPRRPHTGARHG